MNQATTKQQKIILPGGAGLVGQNLIVRLKERGYSTIVVLDKHLENLKILRELHPDIIAEYVDLADNGKWQEHFCDANIVIMLQAQIGASSYQPFERNNVDSTKNILQIIEKYQIQYLIHISSSVVKSEAQDYYTKSKTQQEELVLNSGINHIILRPTLMFGWFDRKHLGWLSRFMKKVPVFPIPGNGRYMRQPLYVGDFCNIIISCLEKQPAEKIFNITGLEQIDYIDIIKSIKRTTNAKSFILKIPYSLFYWLLKIWVIFDKQPPFTAEQLKALVTDDEFEVIDWPKIFDVAPTPLNKAIDQTFNDQKYSKVILKF